MGCDETGAALPAVELADRVGGLTVEQGKQLLASFKAQYPELTSACSATQERGLGLWAEDLFKRLGKAFPAERLRSLAPEARADAARIGPTAVQQMLRDLEVHLEHVAKVLLREFPDGHEARDHAEELLGAASLVGTWRVGIQEEEGHGR